MRNQSRMTNRTIVLSRKPARSVKKSANLLALTKFFMVQGVGFRCVAYRDQKGRWRDALNNGELFGDIRILE